MDYNSIKMAGFDFSVSGDKIRTMGDSDKNGNNPPPPASTGKNRIVRIKDNVYNIYIRDVIFEFEQYCDIIDAIHTLTESDLVNVYLNSPGGRIDIAMEIREAIQNSPAFFIAKPIDTNCSASTLIALSCDDIEIHPTLATFMIHAPSYNSVYSSHNKVEDWANYFPESLARLVREIYKGFLSEDEIQSILKGKDLYLVGEEVQARWDAMKKADEDAKLYKESLEMTGAIETLINGYLDKFEGNIEIQLPEGIKRSRVKLKELK